MQDGESRGEVMQHAFPQLEHESGFAAKRFTILVVDDNEEQAFSLSNRLESLGYRTEIAHAGRHALATAQLEQPNLVLLNLRLPDISGLEVCSQMADHPETCAIPIILVSDIERRSIVREARAAGCRFFIRKPYDPDALLVLIEHALSEWQ